MHYSSNKLCKRGLTLLILTLVTLQLMGCGQRGPLTLPKEKPVAESTESVEK
ncbi:LPS translocon maturation chaperone LptM [Psychrosphaera saromensis]|uniref:LPS translocon maturation chaperone LptM n=1 Tax=Psychrosphaera saromensis TaxID=716813 RepID=UPI003570EB5B